MRAYNAGRPELLEVAYTMPNAQGADRYTFGERSGDEALFSSAIGQMAGEYRLLAKLGEGGCGAVYAAEHPVLKRRAAVKVLHRTPAAGSSGLGRFIAEARAVHQVRSRHIVDVFSFGELEDGRPFYVMDLLEGEPLDRYLARLGRLSVAATLQILRPLAGALDLAHAAGIIHRDVKPQNVFLALEDGEIVPKLLDFGVAKLTHDVGALTVSGAVVGTPLYMSPEQARGEQVDARSDVYALGVLAHELLTGCVPIRADNTIGLALALLTQAPTRPSELCRELPAQVDEPIVRMLEKSPDARPANAGEAIALLLRAAEGAGLECAPGLGALPALVPLGEHVRVLAATVTASGIVPVARAHPAMPGRQQTGPTQRASGLAARGIVSALAVALLVALVVFVSRFIAAPTNAPLAVAAAVAEAPPAVTGPAASAPAAASGADASARASAPSSRSARLVVPSPPVSPARAGAEALAPGAKPATLPGAAEPAAVIPRAPPASPRNVRVRPREQIPSDLENPF